jgi:hypothetical protein
MQALVLKNSSLFELFIKVHYFIQYVLDVLSRQGLHLLN